MHIYLIIRDCKGTVNKLITILINVNGKRLVTQKSKIICALCIEGVHNTEHLNISFDITLFVNSWIKLCLIVCSM